MIGNNYVSSYPKANVKISPEFRSWGTYRYETSGSDYYDPTGINKSTARVELTLLVPTQMQKQNYEKGIYIFIREIVSPGWFYMGAAFAANNKYFINKGIATFGGNQYEHVTRVAFNEMRDHISEQVLKAGLIAPSCMLTKSYVKTWGKETRIFINYFEDTAPSGFEKNRWLDKTRYVEAQHKYIEEFEKRANKALEILQ